MGQFWRDENYLDGGGWWLLFMIVFWGLAFILPIIFFAIKRVPNSVKTNLNFFRVLFVIIAIFICVIVFSSLSVN